MRSLVEGVFDHLAVGDVAAVDDHVAQGRQFNAFVLNPERWGEPAADRSTLTTFVASFGEAPVDATLMTIGIAYRAEDATGHFTMQVDWQRADEPSVVRSGKGVVDCSSGRVTTFVLGPPDEG